MKQSIGLVGFGTFAQFMVPYLTPYFNLLAWNRSDQSEMAKKLNVDYMDLPTVLNQKIIILCTNAQSFENLLRENAPLFNPNAIVLDVASIKIKPVELMLKYLPISCEIVGTHPLFGPESGRFGIQNLNFVLCPVRTTHVSRIYAFVAKILKMKVLIRTPEAHDKEMAYVQGLTHFIARAVDMMNIPEIEQKTKAYESLLAIRKMLASDSFELFKTIQNDNPFAEKIRTNFKNSLQALEEKIK